MGLKIKDQIGCDQGITDAAYVRINTYRIDKISGVLELNYSTFLNQEVAKNINNSYQTPLSMRALSTSAPIRNIQLGEQLLIPLQKTVVQIITVTENKPVVKEITKEIESTIEGVTTSQIITEHQTIFEPTTSTKEIEVTVPDLSQIENCDIFTFCYNKLKLKLQESFSNIEDC